MGIQERASHWGLSIHLATLVLFGEAGRKEVKNKYSI